MSHEYIFYINYVYCVKRPFVKKKIGAPCVVGIADRSGTHNVTVYKGSCYDYQHLFLYTFIPEMSSEMLK